MELTKEQKKLINAPTDTMTTVVLFKDRAKVTLTKSFVTKQLNGRNKYYYRIIAEFLYNGKKEITNTGYWGKSRALKQAAILFEQRNRQTIKEEAKLGRNET